MTNLLDRLRAYLDAPATVQLAQAAPLGVLAGLSAATIAAVIGLPAFATSGLGIIFGGLAVNFTSALIDKIVHAGERERPRLIQQGLRDGDSDVQLLVAGALTHAGPDVAAALPAAEREELIAAFEQGMRAGGGPLASIAGRYAGALRNPNANWGALQATLLPEVLAVSQEIRGADLVEGARQTAREIEGNVKQLIEGKIVRGVEQVASGVKGARPPAAPRGSLCPDCGAPLPVGTTTCPRCGLALAPAGSPTPRSQGADAVLLSVRFAPTAGGAALTWSGDSIGQRLSSFVSPYVGADLALVLRALDVLQHPEAGLNAQQLARLDALGLPNLGGILDSGAHRVVGHALFQQLTADPEAAKALASARNAAERADLPLSLSLHLPPGAAALAALPWELLWEPGETTPLLLSRNQAGQLTRHLDLAQAVSPARTGGKPLRVRAIAPRAGVQPEARAAEETARSVAWAPLVQSGAVTLLPTLSPATSVFVADMLRTGGPLDVLHFVGKGYVKDGEGHLVLDREDGNWAPTEASRLAPAIANTGVGLVVLASCQSASLVGVGEGLLGSVAPALIAHGVPVVVAMQFTMREPAAHAATRVIYEELAAGKSVQAAVAAARLHLWTTEPERSSWYVPTVYTRSGSEQPMRLV